MSKQFQGESKGKETAKEETGISEKVLFINRCSKVVKGGRKFSFSALVLVGDFNGKVGYGFAKANELTDAIKKAGQLARRDMISFNTYQTTIPHEVRTTWDGVMIMLKPAPEGTGVVAGSVMRSILEMTGVLRDVVCKSLGCSNPINLVRATFKALKKLKSRKEIYSLRGIKHDNDARA